MTTTTIWDRVREKPFRPFRIIVSDGRRYDVHHPDTIIVAKQSITIGLYDRKDRAGEEPASRTIVISPLHVTSVEDVADRRPQTRRRKAS